VVKINKIKANPSDERPTIFHGLLSSPLPDSEKSSARLAEEASVLLSAGTDSSANTLAAITYHLLSSPSILQKLRKELISAIPNTEERQFPPLNKVETLPFLSAIIQEGLRLHPAIASRQQRVAPTEDLVYTSPSSKAYRLPKGTTMSMSPHLLSRIEDVYPDPMEFRPERFLGEEGKALRGLTMALSKGGRMCLGMQLAYQEMFVLLAGIFGRFDGPDGVLAGSQEGVEGEGGKRVGEWLELFETDRSDVEAVRDLVSENVRDGSEGVRVVVKAG
jgi:cytochrome P450